MGLYWRCGALLRRVSQPGVRLKLPFFDRCVTIPVGQEMTQIKNTTCFSKGGIRLLFGAVEVCSIMFGLLAQEIA